jgi:hypothetical protein
MIPKIHIVFLWRDWDTDVTLPGEETTRCGGIKKKLKNLFEYIYHAVYVFTYISSRSNNVMTVLLYLPVLMESGNIIVRRELQSKNV